MAQQRAWGSTFSAVQTAADRALNSAEGITLFFRLDKYGTPQACAQAARAFQNAFCSLRARARKNSERNLLGEGGKNWRPAVSDAAGPYDKIVCERRELPNGEWKIGLIPSGMYLIDVEIIDNATGEPLEELGASAEKMNLLNLFLEAASYKRLNPTLADREIPVEKWDRLTQLHTEDFPEALAWHLNPADPTEEWWPRSRCVNPSLATSLAQLEEHRTHIDDVVDAVAHGGSIFGND